METFISRKRNKLFSGRIGGGNIAVGYTVRIRGLFAAIHECIQLVCADTPSHRHEQRQTHPLADALPNRLGKSLFPLHTGRIHLTNIFF